MGSNRCSRSFQVALSAVSSAIVLSWSAAGAQEQLLMINGQALDSKPFQATFEKPFWSTLAATACERVSWRPDLATPAARTISTSPLRKRLREAIGPELPERAYITGHQQVFRGSRYTIERIQIDGRVANIRSFAYVVHPVMPVRKSPAVVLLHGSGMLPKEAFGWKLSNAYRVNERAGNAAFIGSALQFAEAGYTVYIPWLADDQSSDYWPRLKWTSLQRAGSSLWPRVPGLGPLHLLLNEISGGIDYLSALPDVDATKLATVGWGEGAELATITAAVDKRVGAVVRLGAPVDRRALRSTQLGVLEDANFMHFDCTLGDFELAALIAPRPLLYAYSTKDESVSRIRSFISGEVSASIRSLYSATGYSNNFALQADIDWGTANSARVRSWLDAALRFSPREVPRAIVVRQPQVEEDYNLNWIDTTKSDRQNYVASLGTCVPRVPHPKTTSVAEFERSLVPFRRTVSAALGLDPEEGRPDLVVTRRTSLRRQRGYELQFVEIKSSRTPIPLIGLLAIPDSLQDHQAPGVVSVDGNFGLGRPFGLPLPEEQPYLNSYADALAKEGTVVFVPYYPTDFPEIAAAELRARAPGKTSYGLMIPLFLAAIDFVESLKQVDTRRIGVWGISYAGTLGLYTAALDKRVTAVVYSNPVVSVDVLFGNRDSALLSAWWPEVCSTIDMVQAYLIAPRRFVRENGLRDANGYERTPLESVKRIREIFESLNLESQFDFVRHDGGHETRPSGFEVFAR